MQCTRMQFHKQDTIPTEPFFTFSIKLPSIVTQLYSKTILFSGALMRTVAHFAPTMGNFSPKLTNKSFVPI